jgi:hypothetical protein
MSPLRFDVRIPIGLSIGLARTLGKSVSSLLVSVRWILGRSPG